VTDLSAALKSAREWHTTHVGSPCVFCVVFDAVAALQGYVSHGPECSIRFSAICNCGLASLLGGADVTKDAP